jgi:hypothetical protein
MRRTMNITIPNREWAALEDLIAEVLRPMFDGDSAGAEEEARLFGLDLAGLAAVNVMNAIDREVRRADRAERRRQRCRTKARRKQQQTAAE